MARILLSSKKIFVSGSRGELISTLSNTVFPSKLTSSRERNLAINPRQGLGVFDFRACSKNFTLHTNARLQPLNDAKSHISIVTDGL